MKFKKGDKVKLIDIDYTSEEHGCVSNMLKIGDIGTIHSVTDNYVYILSEGDENPYAYSPLDLELVVERKKEVNVKYIVSPSALTVVFDGKSETIAQGDHRYAQVLEAIKQGNLEAIPSLVDVQKSFDGIENVELVDGRILINGKTIPQVLNDRVLGFKEQGLPFEPLVKFAEKLQENPSYNSRQMLYKFLEHNGHPITENGNFIAYKKVRTDFKDCHTGTMDNSVGQVVSMPREEVDDNPDNTCSSGLHVAAYDYAKNFASGHLVLVEVDPRDVVSVPNDYNGEKMRVCRYEVKEVCESRLETEFYGEVEESSDDCFDECPDCGDFLDYDDYVDECHNCGRGL